MDVDTNMWRRPLTHQGIYLPNFYVWLNQEMVDLYDQNNLETCISQQGMKDR